MADLRLKQKQQKLLQGKQQQQQQSNETKHSVNLTVTNELGELIEPISVDTKMTTSNEVAKQQQPSPADAFMYNDLYNDVELNNNNEHSTLSLTGDDQHMDFIDNSLTVNIILILKFKNKPHTSLKLAKAKFICDYWKFYF